MIRLLVLLLVLVSGSVNAQRLEVLPNDAEINVTIENPQSPFLESEMVLLTIHGIYRRYITREELIQPALNGFGWMQLGEDYWYDSQENGLKVKNMRRRMAIFPNRAGKMEIGAFQHRLTFLDEDLKWFEHEIASEPIVIDVGRADDTADWWLPVHRLEVEDSWSNPPDQMKAGDGVLRVIRVEGHGASTDMLPPMPEMHSPSAHIFPHPEKRLVELTPKGPVAVAFWRWTLRPTNDVSAIIEPLKVEFYDTIARENKEVTISTQRIAYGSLTGRERPDPSVTAALINKEIGPAIAPFWTLLAGFATVFVFVLALMLRTVSAVPMQDVLRRLAMDADSRALRRAAKDGEVGPFRTAAHALVAQTGLPAHQFVSLRALDTALFSKPRKDVALSKVMQQLRAELNALSN